jgi:hypothetical protein
VVLKKIVIIRLGMALSFSLTVKSAPLKKLGIIVKVKIIQEQEMIKSLEKSFLILMKMQFIAKEVHVMDGWWLLTPFFYLILVLIISFILKVMG